MFGGQEQSWFVMRLRTALNLSGRNRIHREGDMDPSGMCPAAGERDGHQNIGQREGNEE